MIAKLLSALMSLIIKLVGLVLAPIDLLINTLLPDLSTAFSSIGGFFQVVSNSLGWVISASGIPASAIAIIVATMVFKLTAPLVVHATKLALSWYDKLKP